MAVATTTAIAVGATLASTGMSFAQAAKQRKLQDEAERDAETLLAEAKSKLDVNFYDKLALRKEPYELERDALLASGAQAIEAARESGRALAGTAGRIQMAQVDQQANVRNSMGKELDRLDQLSLAEQSRLQGLQANLLLEETAGAQQAAGQANAFSNQAVSNGLAGVSSLAGQLASTAPLYKKSKWPNATTADIPAPPPAPPTINNGVPSFIWNDPNMSAVGGLQYGGGFPNPFTPR